MSPISCKPFMPNGLPALGDQIDRSYPQRRSWIILDARMLTRTIASSGEALPVIGIGTYKGFDVGSGSKERAALGERSPQPFFVGRFGPG